ncbi:aldose epimerase family protein [Clostridium nigeriense]|uniref:aldose epimerase family protein n=1 Tax=Clostridium nigeriense TaxID=1805470 RepID=UPI003D34F61E
MEIREKLLETKKYKYNYIELLNDNNISIKILDLGAIITEINTPDREGNIENIVLTFEDYDTYLKNPGYLGTIIGRNSGRVGNGEFEIQGELYKLEKNEGNNTLHGGFNGFNFKRFDFKTFKNNHEVGVIFSYLSLEGEGGFPGEVLVKIKYTLNNENEFKISYEGKTNKKTILNMTNHSYFNLSGNAKRKITEHLLYIDSDKITEIDNESIVTGKMIDVSNTPFDFREPKKVGQDVYKDYYQLNITRGYDHYFELNNNDEEKKIIELYDEESGRCLEIYTNCNGVVVYSCNYLNNKRLSIGRELEFKDAICLETQNIPIGRNNLFIEDSIIDSNELYSKETIYKITIK